MDPIDPRIVAAFIGGIFVVIAALIGAASNVLKARSETAAATARSIPESRHGLPPWFWVIAAVVLLLTLARCNAGITPTMPEVDLASPSPTSATPISSPTAEHGQEESKNFSVQWFLDDYAADVWKHRFDHDETVLDQYIEFPMQHWYGTAPATRAQVAVDVWPATASSRVYEPAGYLGTCIRSGDVIAVRAQVHYYDKTTDRTAEVKVVYKLRISTLGQPYRIISVEENGPCTI